MSGHTLKLNDQWDIYVDASGNIAMCSQDEAVIQNVSNAIRLFKNDAYYDPDRGLSHFNLELQERPLISVMRQRFISTAESIQGVKSAQVTNIQVKNRELTGTIEVTLNSGVQYSVEI